MNASYKIALLAAFAVLAIVVSYYAFLAGPPAQEQDPAPNAIIADSNGNDDDGDTPAPPINNNRPPRPAPLSPITPPPTTPGGTPANPSPVSPGTDIIIGPQPGEDTLGPATPGTEQPDTPDTPTPRVPYPGATPGGTPGGPSSPATPGTPGSPEPGPDTPRTPVTPRTPAVEPAPTPRTPAAPRTYTVQPGDTLSAIAVKVFGEEAAWVDIAQANPSLDPLRLQPGQVLIMPSREVVEEQGEPAPPAPGQEQRYTIRPGDNLSRIAQRFYDDPDAWQVIYNRNRDKIGPTPDRLQAGMEIIIPPRYGGAN